MTGPVPVEHIHDEAGRLIALVLRGTYEVSQTTFVTPPDAALQVGLIAHMAGGSVARHRHHPIERTLVGTPEVLVVREGRTEVELFGDSGARLASYELSPGDVIVLLGGGHGFRMLKDTVLLEVKQGPYPGVDEKERF